MPPLANPQNPTQQPPRLPSMLAQPTPNPNYIQVNPLYNNGMSNYQTYSLNVVEINDINLKSRKVLDNNGSSLGWTHDKDKEESMKISIGD